MLKALENQVNICGKRVSPHMAFVQNGLNELYDTYSKDPEAYAKPIALLERLKTPISQLSRDYITLMGIYKDIQENKIPSGLLSTTRKMQDNFAELERISRKLRSFPATSPLSVVSLGKVSLGKNIEKISQFQILKFSELEKLVTETAQKLLS